MDRIAKLPALCFAGGVVVGTAICHGGPWTIFPLVVSIVGLIATAIFLIGSDRRALPWVAAGFFVAIIAAGYSARAPHTPLQQAIASGPVDLLLAADVLDGPRRSGDGYSYTVRVVATDEIPDRAMVRAWTEGSTPPAWPGDRIELFARCRRFAAADFPTQPAVSFWESRDVTGTCRTLEPPVITGRFATPSRWLAMRRHRLETRLVDLLGRRAGVPLAMLTGTRSLITPSERRAHQRAGTAHLLAISGLHFGALATIVWVVGGWLVRRSASASQRWGSRRPTALLVVGVMAAYLVFVGAPISALRAFLAAAALGLATVSQRAASGVTAVAVGATAVLLTWPAQIAQLGFQLSFVATAAIVLFWHRRPKLLAPDQLQLQRRPVHERLRAAAGFVMMSWYATAATAPLIVGAFGELSFVAFATNLFAVPIVTLLVFPTLLIGSVLLEVAPAVGEPLVWWSTDAMLQLTVLMEAAADLPFAVLNPGSPPSLLVWFLVALVFVCLAAASARRTVTSSIIIAASALTIWAHLQREPGWRVTFIPVGQGDAILVEAPTGDRILVDAGGSRWGRDPGRFVVVPYLRRVGVERLDALVVSHADMDHAGGVPAVLEELQVDRLVTKPVALEIDGVRLSRWTSTGSRNDRSIVVRVTGAHASVLLTGDVEAAAELNHLGDARRNTVIKVPHHGSKTSSSPALLDAIRPTVAVVSAGRHNTFGHPHPDVVERYRARGTSVLSTADHGLVVVQIDSDGLLRVRAHRW